MADPLALISPLVDILQAVKPNIVNDTPRVAEALDHIILDLQNSLRTMDKPLSELCLIEFADKGSVARAREVLDRVVVGSLRDQVREAHFSCSDIRTIYKKYLSGWFNKHFAKNQSEIDRVFSLLGDADELFVENVSDLSNELQKKANSILEELENGNLSEADCLAKELRVGLRATRAQLSQQIDELVQIRNQFRQSVGAKRWLH